MSADLGRILVCEKTGQWAVALRRVLGDTDHPVHETRSLAECWAQLSQHPASLVVFELTAANVQAVVERLMDLTRRFRQARAVVVGVPEMEPFEVAARAAGAVGGAFSLLQLAPCGRMIERHLRSLPPPTGGLRESVRRRLPWGP